MKTLSAETIIRAWRDEAFRQSLPEDERRLVPANPAGAIGSALVSEWMGTPGQSSFAPCTFNCSFAPCSFAPCDG